MRVSTKTFVLPTTYCFVIVIPLSSSLPFALFLFVRRGKSQYRFGPRQQTATKHRVDPHLSLSHTPQSLPQQTYRCLAFPLRNKEKQKPSSKWTSIHTCMQASRQDSAVLENLSVFQLSRTAFSFHTNHIHMTNSTQRKHTHTHTRTHAHALTHTFCLTAVVLWSAAQKHRRDVAAASKRPKAPFASAGVAPIVRLRAKPQRRGGYAARLCENRTRSHTDTQTHRGTHTHTHRHTEAHTHRHTDGQTDRHTDTQPHLHTDT